MMMRTAMMYMSGVFCCKNRSRCWRWIDDDENDGDDVHEWRFVFASWGGKISRLGAEATNLLREDFQGMPMEPLLEFNQEKKCLPQFLRSITLKELRLVIGSFSHVCGFKITTHTWFKFFWNDFYEMWWSYLSTSPITCNFNRWGWPIFCQPLLYLGYVICFILLGGILGHQWKQAITYFLMWSRPIFWLLGAIRLP